MKVPFFRPSVGEAEIEEVVGCLRTGWLTTGPLTAQFEREFAAAVGARHALALNSCTAALHLAVEALGLAPRQAVLVPTMTFAATAEIVRYQGAMPILVDCDPLTGNMDLADAERKLADLKRGRSPFSPDVKPVGIIPVHVGGLMMDVEAVHAFAKKHALWVVEDAAHAMPASWRRDESRPWQRCGEGTAAVTCYSFYANKTITTGEGGMAVTDDADLFERMKLMALHGLSRDAWARYAGGPWDYRIVAPGFKYNLTDVASAIGIHQLRRAEAMRQSRAERAAIYREAFADLDEVELPPDPANRIHSWHLFPISLRLERLPIDRNEFVRRLAERGVGFSVHWRPLHLHPYYADQLGWTPEMLPIATREWVRRVSLPLFPAMTDAEQSHVIAAVKEVCRSAPPVSVALPSAIRCDELAEVTAP
ncbi:MAG: DegT/DnrJ/EryC1/StrS aminotransferase family protein [Gemmataceae bacterium]